MNIKFNKEGLIPAIVQDEGTARVLMLAFMSEQSLKITKETGRATFFSRSREKLWTKGEKSGNYLFVKSIKADCDGDSLLLTVRAAGPACHTGEESCFFREVEGIMASGGETGATAAVIAEVFEKITERKETPKEGSYTNYLFDKGIDKILKKVGEEAAEVIIAAKNNEKDEISYETADLIYHLLVMLAEKNMTPGDVYKRLKERQNPS